MYQKVNSLVGLGTDALQVLSLSAQLLWVGLGHIVGAVGGAIVGLVLVSQQVRGVRLLQGMSAAGEGGSACNMGTHV
jgi:hypothetical protein